jgi:CRISPR-associated protein Cas2
MTTLSGYRILWLQVAFDLPTNEKKERKQASHFRKFLLDLGFEMCQYSIYMRWCSGKEMLNKYVKLIEKQIPESGKVSLLTFTDKQYENIVSFKGKKQKENPKNPEQLRLF